MNERQQSETDQRIEDLALAPHETESVKAAKNVAKFKVSSELAATVTK